MRGQKNEGDDVWFGRPSASLVPNTKMKSIIQKGGILALAYFSVKKREWQVQLGLGGSCSRVQKMALSKLGLSSILAPLIVRYILTKQDYS